MPKTRTRQNSSRNRPASTGANLGFEPSLWQAANALRGSMDAAEYKHVVLGLIFLKYISDAFEEHRKRLEQEPYADPEDPDEYRAANVFWVPPEARWERLRQNARQPTIGQIVDEAMEAVEQDNPSLKGVLPKDYARPALDKQRLGHPPDRKSRCGTAVGRCSSSTPAGWAVWWTASAGSSPTRRSRTSPAPTTPCRANTTRASTRTSPASARSATLEQIRQHGYVHPGTICGSGGGSRTRQAL